MSTRVRFLGPVLILAVVVSAMGSAMAGGARESVQSVLDRAVKQGRLDRQVVAAFDKSSSVKALVGFDDSAILARATALAPEGAGRSTVVLAVAKPAFAAQKSTLLRSLGDEAEVIRDYDAVATIFLKFESRESVRKALQDPAVVSIHANRLSEANLNQSLTLVNQPLVAGSNRGAGASVAVLDSGIDFTRAAFGSCTAVNTPSSTCRVPFAQDFSDSDQNGTVDNDNVRDNGTFHGTNVAGIAGGVAGGAKLLSLDITFTNANNQQVSWSTDQIAAMNWVANNQATYNIRSYNLSSSQRNTYNTAVCANDAIVPAVNSVRAVNVLPVHSAGNSARADLTPNDGIVNPTFNNGIATPSCATGVVSVGAVYDSNIGTFQGSCTDNTTAADQITCFSQTAGILSMLAPGSSITAAGITTSGTSQAAPHVAGAAAVLAAANPTATLASIQSALTDTGLARLDARNNVTKRRLDLNAAILRIDTIAPTVSSVPKMYIQSAEKLTSSTIPVVVSWVARDSGGSGLSSYWLQKSVNGGAFSSVTPTSLGIMPLPTGSVLYSARMSLPVAGYRFRVQMVDRTGNWSLAYDSIYQNLTAVQETSSSIVFWTGGQWVTDSSCSGDLCHFGGAARRSSSSGAWVAYGFSGSQIAWVSKKAPDGAWADVYVDGWYQTTVDLSAASADYRRVVFQKTWTQGGSHSIEIRLTSSGSYVPMDAFLVVS